MIVWVGKNLRSNQRATATVSVCSKRVYIRQVLASTSHSIFGKPGSDDRIVKKERCRHKRDDLSKKRQRNLTYKV